MNVWKFISRSSNYRVTLKTGMPAEPLTGRNAVPGVYAKFENGILTTQDEEFADMLMRHSAFNTDYILADDENKKDPYLRKEIEPEHDITELQYGHVGKSINPKPQNRVTPEMMKKIEEIAENLAKQKFVELVKAYSKDSNKDVATKEDADVDGDAVEVASEEQSTTEEKSKKKAGRPKKSKN